MTPTGRSDGVAGVAGVTAARHEAGEVLAVARGSGELAAGNFFEFATRFAIAFLLARSLGAGGYGLYVLAISAATLFSGISLLGLDDAMTRYVAIASGRRDAPAVRGTIQVGLVAAAAMGVLCGAVLYLGADPIATGLFNEPQLARLLQLVALAVPFLSVSNVLAGTARGFRRMDIAALAENVVQSVVRLGLLTVAFLLTGLSTATAVVVFGISDVAATVTMVMLLGRHFPLAPRGQPVRRDARGVFRFALPLWFSGMLRQFRGNLVALLLGATGPAANVGVFAVVNKINLVGHVWLLSIFMAVKPTMAQLHDRGDRAELARVYTSTTRWSLSLGLPFVIAMVLYREPILATFGTSFSAGSTALVILAMAELANAGTGTCQSMIDMTGHTRLKVANAVLWTGLLIGSGSFLIPRWGVVGAATASLIAIATVNLLSVAQVWALEHVVPYDRAFWKPLAAGAGAWTTGIVLDRLLPVGADLAPAVLEGVVVVAVFAGLIGLFGLSAEDRLVLDRIRDGVVARRARHTQPGRPAAVGPAGRRRRRAPRARGVWADRGPAVGPVYIGGLDRSGKTTLAAFLTSHPNLDIPDAGSNLWTYFYGRFGDLGRPANLERCLDLMQRYRHVAILHPDPHRIRREFSAGPPTYARLFGLVHAHHAERQGKPRWGTQTGLIERYADELFAAYPGVRIIHMIRDPRDRHEASQALWPRGKGQAGGATARWVYSTHLAERHMRRHPGGYLIVRFEDLVQRTEETLRAVCDFLGEAFDPDMLGMPAAPERRTRLASRRPAPSAMSATTTGVLSTAPAVTACDPLQPPLSTAFIGRFRERVSTADVAFIQLHAGRLMPAYGYLPVPLAWGTHEWARFFTRTWPGQAARMLAWRGREALQQRFPTRAGRTPDARLVAPKPEAVR